MDNEKLVSAWQRTIIDICAARLARPLSSAERNFLTQIGGFQALEMIEDTVRQIPADKLASYLASGVTK
jgi:hypothetical protein